MNQMYINCYHDSYAHLALFCWPQMNQMCINCYPDSQPHLALFCWPPYRGNTVKICNYCKVSRRNKFGVVCFSCFFFKSTYNVKVKCLSHTGFLNKKIKSHQLTMHRWYYNVRLFKKKSFSGLKIIILCDFTI